MEKETVNARRCSCARRFLALDRQTLEASSKFNDLFKSNKVRKGYLVICHGDPGRDSVVDQPLYRRSSGKVAAVSKGQAERFGARTASTRIQNVASIGGIGLFSSFTHRTVQSNGGTRTCAV